MSGQAITIHVKSSAAARIRAGGLWIFSNEINESAREIEAGSAVSVCDPRGTPFAMGYIEPHSLIAIRVMGGPEDAITSDLVRRRIESAAALRKTLGVGRVCRVVFSEADLLPGLIVDRYDDVFVVQCLTWGMERLKGTVTDALRKLFDPRAVIMQNDNEARASLGLPCDDEIAWCVANIDLSEHVVSVAGLAVGMDFAASQKTGLFLDQAAAYRIVSELDFSGLHGVDCFCYSGIFGMLALTRGASRVEFVDSSEAAVHRLKQNLGRNGIDANRAAVTRADALRSLASRKDASEDFLFLDPPKLIKSRKSFHAGMQHYFILNREASRVLRDGGYLFTFSCSHHAGAEAFRAKVVDAAAKAHRGAIELARFRQNVDHPVPAAHPESDYLKGFLFRLGPRSAVLDAPSHAETGGP